MPVAASALEDGTDESVARFYNDRVTDCEFLDDPDHYEYPRSQWVLSEVSRNELLEVGCGNGGMTRLLSPVVTEIVAFDVSEPSLEQLRSLNLSNVTTIQGLLENLSSERKFDQVLMSEVIEHLRDPLAAAKKAYELVSPGGKLIMTTPNGHWESDEHLHEFSMDSFAALIVQTGCESFECSYLRDRDNRRRWLTAIARKPEAEPFPDDFFDRRAVARKRRTA